MIRVLLALLLTAPADDGWTDLFPAKDLKGWTRVPIKPLADKKVWSVSEDGKTLVVDGVGAVEMLLFDQEFGDGTFHVEWRWREHTDPKGVYNGGIYVRTAADGKTWVQAQVARADKSPVVGDLMGMIPGDEKRQDHFHKASASPEKPLGEWNAYDIECKGSTIKLSVNGTPTATWENCPLLKGRVGLQAEFAVIEVRAVRFKPQ